MQTAWLGYCAENYFKNATNHTGLALSEMLAWTPPENVTNVVTYWPNSTLPRTVTGWSRNWITLPGNEQPVELKQYPEGFKVWKFTATDDVLVNGTRFPRRLTLEGFVPKPPKDATTGDETTLLRRVTFVADSVEIDAHRFDPLPPIPVADLPINDKRFVKETWPEILRTQATPKSGWPMRSSTAFKVLQQQVRDIAFENEISQPNPRRARIAIFVICGINLIALVFVVRAILKRKQQNQ